MSRRSSRKRNNSPDDSPAEDVSPTVSRRSGRSNKFSSSLKEPDNSIKDLLGGLSERIPASKKQKSSSSRKKNDEEDEEDEAESTSEEEPESELDSEEDEDEEVIPESPVKRTSSRTRRKPTAAKVTSTPLQKRTRRKPKSPKSPAVRHSSTRKKIKLEKKVETDSEFESEESDNDSDGSEDDEPEIKIQRIVASRMESKRKWKEICSKTNTSEIDNGSRWFQEEPSKEDLDKFEERFLVKWADLSFLHCSWERKDDLMAQVEGAKPYLTTFFRKSYNGYIYDADERMDGEYFDPSFVQIDRILEVELPDGWKDRKGDSKKDNDWGIIYDVDHPDYENCTGRSFLVKWGSTSYEDATYEYERDLIMMDVEYESALEEFLKRSKKPTKSVMKKVFSSHEDERRRLYKIFGDRVKDGEEKEKRIDDYKQKLQNYNFKNGGQLRDYQAEGVSWLLANHVNKRSAILADEMGLGKTIQTAAYVEMISSGLHCRGPFLIVAPLSTIPHWQREFTGWTDLNTIVYHGSQNNRETIREFEFAYECDRPQGGVGYNQRYLKKCHHRKATKAERIWMAQVVITTPEMLVTDDFAELTTVEWELLVVDEAHRLKSHTSKLALNLRDDRFTFNHTLLLTGTPIQNNMNELWALMNVIDPDEFDDIDEFMERYDNMQSKERVDELHELIRPYILRRLKEDVEKSVPPKEETLIEVELTVLQKQYYRALYEKNVQFLHRDVKKALDGPSLNNISMQLRKCCNHPFLLEGVEEKAKKDNVFKNGREEADFLAKASGKLVLLDKLLPKLKDGGHRVLIFSQFKIMLDIIEDYLSLREFKHERIDGSITGKKRQMAIDRFQSKTSSIQPFVMLLSTRAGGVGINLTAADTCIIFDSDWNPQNDLQAQARCHRIGQTKSVKVYRLLTRKTYEMQMFHMSSLKMGLDQAVLQGIENGGDGNGHNMTKEEVEKLLRHGAYDMFQEEQAGTAEKESKEFIEQDIDTILERRAKTVIHENTGSKSNAAGGTFSKASFKALAGTEANTNSDQDVDIDDPDFWKKVVGEAKVENTDVLQSGKKRSRKKAIVYNEKHFDEGLEEKILESDSESSASADSEESYQLDDDNADDMDEYDLSKAFRNTYLNQLTQRRKEELQRIERKRWGGKSSTQWHKNDVDALLKLLLRYGYGNLSLDGFASHFKAVSSKQYDEVEIRRMSWSLCLTALQEAARENVADVARRVEREAKKKRDGAMESALQNGDAKSSNTDTEEWKAKQLIQSFEKYWSSSQWAVSALQDAFEFAQGRCPRDAAQLDFEGAVDEQKPLLEAFSESLLPALKNRGWVEKTPTNGKKRAALLAPNGLQLYSITEVLDRVPQVHPELEATVESFVEIIAKKILSMNKSGRDSLPTDIFEADKMTPDKLALLLDSYAPCQLIMDRKHSKRIKMTPMRVMSTLSCVHNAHVLVKTAGTNRNAKGGESIEAYLKLSLLLAVNSKAALPHPKWTTVHDAILLTAIVKHGWIDRESHCQAIVKDRDIKWGHPFDKAVIHQSVSNSSELVPSTKQDSPKNMRLVANRVADFLNNNQELIKGSKVFNLHLILKSYSIVPSASVEETTKKWEVDYGDLENGPGSSDVAEEVHDSDEAELPERKDLMRRVKTILSKPLKSTPQSDSKSLASAQNFSVLDQSQVSNVFLAELLREVIKVGQKQQKWIDTLLATAASEAELLSNESSEECAAELNKISKHILLAKQYSKPFVRGAKNVIRVILGLDVHQRSKPGESVFVEERKRKVDRPKSVRKSSIKRKEKRKNRGVESTTGDTAVNKALSIGKYPERNITIPKDNYLRLTSIETLMLSVLCSQGMPICDDNWRSVLDEDMDEDETFSLSWPQTGCVLEAAAETWYNMTASRVDKAKNNGEEISSSLADEMKGRQLVYSEATNLRENPVNLAKKAIMLIQAVRNHTGKKLKSSSKKDTAIGMRTLQWNSNHMVKWSQSLGIYFNGKVLSNTVLAAKPKVTPSAFFDQKGCAAVYSQIVQQTRLRALYVKYEEKEIHEKMLPKALKNCDANGNEEWIDRPSWWGNDPNSPLADDKSLIWGILQYGYGGFDEMIRMDERFSEFCTKETGVADTQFDRLSAQQRLNCLTREIGAIDDTLESMRLINERKQNPSVGRIENNMKNSSANAVQVGIDAFFAPQKKAEVVEIMSDDNSVEVVEFSSVTSGKRKDNDGVDLSPEKKRKT